MLFLPSPPRGASLLNLFKAFPDTSISLIQFHEVLLRGPSPFTEGERELITAYVSGLNQCRYCTGVYVATAELLGTPKKAVESLIDDIETAPMPTDAWEFFAPAAERRYGWLGGCRLAKRGQRVRRSKDAARWHGAPCATITLPTPVPRAK